MQNLQKKLTRALAVGLVLIMGFVLAGCEGIAAGKLNIDLSFDKEGHLTGTYKLVVDTALIEKELSASGASLNKDEVAKQLEGVVNDLKSDAPEGMTVEKIDTDSEAGLVITLDKVPAADFDIDGIDGPDVELVEAEGYVAGSAMNPVGPEVLFNYGLPTDPSEVLTEAQMKFTFPGDVEHHYGGQASGNTVTWDLLSFEGFAMGFQAKSSSSVLAGTGFSWTFIAGFIGWTVVPIIIAVVIVVIVVKRQKKQRLAPTSSGGSGPYPHAGQQTANPGQVPHGGQNPPQGYPGQQPPQNPRHGSGPTSPNPPQR